MTSIQIFVFDQNNNLLASRPDFEGNSQLEGGLLSAIFSFSNTIDEKKISSINFAEYTINFYKKEHFSLAFKTSRELNEKMTKELFEFVKNVFDNMVRDGRQDPVSIELTLEAVMDEIEQKYENCVISPIKENKPYYFVMQHDEEGVGWKIIEKSEMSAIMAQIGYVVNKHRKHIIPEKMGKKNNSLFYLKEAESGVFATCEFKENKTEIVYVNITDTQFDVLLMMKERYDKILRLNQDKPLLQVFGMIQKSLICNIIPSLKDETSLELVKDYIKNKIHLAINLFVTSSKTIVVGEKPVVYTAINTLRFFNQHLNASTNYWLDDIRGIDKDTFIGMSVQKYQSIDELEIDIQDTAIIDLNEGKIKNNTCPIKDKYFKQFIDDDKLIFSDVQSQLKLINDIVRSILQLSSHTKKELQQKIAEYRSAYNSSLVSYALVITQKINPFLEHIIEEII